MWTKEKMDFLDCGDEAADWVTEVIKGDKNVEGKLRLGYWDYPRNWKSGSDENYNERVCCKYIYKQSTLKNSVRVICLIYSVKYFYICTGEF